MSFLEEIYATYRWFAAHVSKEGPEPKDPPEIDAQRMAELNDYAYFLLLFGQLEDYVNRQYEFFVGPLETAFAHRVNVLFDKASARTATVMKYYEIRCDIAHGYAEEGLLRQGIQISDVYEDIRVIVSGHA